MTDDEVAPARRQTAALRPCRHYRQATARSARTVDGCRPARRG